MSKDAKVHWGRVGLLGIIVVLFEMLLWKFISIDGAVVKHQEHLDALERRVQELEAKAPSR
jgi:hypothetical protein